VQCVASYLVIGGALALAVVVVVVVIIIVTKNVGTRKGEIFKTTFLSISSRKA
jgi:hypothetical protein